MTSSNDFLNDDVNVQVSLNKNEFNSYRRQDMLFITCFK
jgi:hypothetical protein